MERLDSLPGGWDPPETEFLILDDDVRTGDWPPLIRALYERHRPREQPAPWVSAPIPSPLARIARFGADRPSLVVASTASEGRQEQATPDYDALAAQVVQDELREWTGGMEMLVGRQAEPAPARVDGHLVMVGGPGSHRMSEAINHALARRAMGVRGFYFSFTGEALSRAGDVVRCWRLLAHDMPDDLGIPDPEEPYAQLPDGLKEDVGILYVGANPLAPRYWLIWVAGLGGVGTVGVGLALREPRVVGSIAWGLANPQAYCCVLLRYRFADEQRPLDGALASVALTRGVLRET